MIAGVDNRLEAVADSVQREERRCYICLEDAEVGVEESGWVSPCRCTGTMAWVHQECLLHWVRDELEHHNASPACKQCLTRFVLTPKKGALFSFLEFFYRRVVPVCKCIGGCFIAFITFTSACITLGVFALVQVYGVDETIAILMAYEGFDAVTYLRCISYSLMVISYVPWEDCLLQVMRRSSRLPLLRAVLPADLPLRFHEPQRKQSICRIVADAVLLPVFANIIGELFFSSVQSPLSRVLIGGAVYLTLKCSFYMYLNQKLMIRRQQIRILPVENVAETVE